tara:strand:- start:996 stop:1793 length:798 start_codon:yes stop_codon:yes gene_type:complete
MLAIKTPKEMKISLLQLSNILLHRDFIKLLLNNNHRFEQFPFVSELVERESLNTLAELKVVAKSVSERSEFRKAVSLSDKDYIISIITQASAAINTLADSMCPDPVTKQLSSFSVRKDETFLEKATQFFGADFGLSVSSSISISTSGYEARDNYNVPSLYYFIGSYLKLRHTTSYITHSPIAEGLINHVLLRGRDYMLNGHPADLFAHDVSNITTAKVNGLQGIYLHDDALITKASIEGTAKPEGNYSTYYDFSELSQTRFELVG